MGEFCDPRPPYQTCRRYSTDPATMKSDGPFSGARIMLGRDEVGVVLDGMEPPGRVEGRRGRREQGLGARRPARPNPVAQGGQHSLVRPATAGRATAMKATEVGLPCLS